MTRPAVAIIGSRGYPSSYGGFETFVRCLAPCLSNNGFDVSVYCRGPGLRTEVGHVDGVRCIHTAGIDRKSTSTLSFGLSAAIDSARRRPDAALVLNVANGFFLPILKRAGIPVAVNVDGVEWERDKWSSLGKRVFRAGADLTARHADAIVVDSKAIGEVWRSTFGVDSTYIPYGAPVIRRRAHNKLDNMGIKPGGYVLVVARLVPENNVELLVDALQRLQFAPPTVIVGSASGSTPLELRLSAISATHPEFRWLGHVDDQDLLTQLWSHCGVYYHGHSVGGTNPGLLQALGCGSPTLAMDTPFNREVLLHEDNLCQPDADWLAARISQILAEPGLRTEMAERGRRVVARRYRWDEVCERYTILMESLIAAKGGQFRFPRRTMVEELEGLDQPHGPVAVPG